MWETLAGASAVTGAAAAAAAANVVQCNEIIARRREGRAKWKPPAEKKVECATVFSPRKSFKFSL